MQVLGNGTNQTFNRIERLLQRSIFRKRITGLLDEQYIDACEFDHSDKSEWKRGQRAAEKVLNPQQLKDLVTKRLTRPEIELRHKPNMNGRRVYQFPAKQYLRIKQDKPDHWFDIQLILSINKRIPIIYESGNATKREISRIYFGSHIYKTHSNSYKCQCGSQMLFDQGEQMLYTTTKQPIIDCPLNHPCKEILSFQLINHEICHNVGLTTNNLSNNIKIHYGNAMFKYRHKFPGFDLSNFPSFENIKSNLKKKKTITDPLEAQSVQDYFENYFEKTLSQFCPSATNYELLDKDVLRAVQDDSFVVSRKELIRILFSSDCIGSDGTFNIRPKLLDGGRAKHRHRQVFKIFALNTYKTKRDRNVTRSYFVAMAVLHSADTDIYKWVYNILLEWAADMNLEDHCPVKQYICDYEKSQRNAAKDILSPMGICISGEEFHYTQAIMKNVQHCHLRTLYDRRFKKRKITYDPKFRMYIEQFLALTHAPPCHVRDFGIKICRNLYTYVATSLELKTHVFHVLDFIHYYLKTWLGYSKTDMKKALEWKHRKHKKYFKKKKCKDLHMLSTNGTVMAKLLGQPMQ